MGDSGRPPSPPISRADSRGAPAKPGRLSTSRGGGLEAAVGGRAWGGPGAPEVYCPEVY